MIKFKKYVCRDCGSEDVSADAWADFNPVTGNYELRSEFDQEFCHTCEGECRTNEVEITDPKEIEQLIILRRAYYAGLVGGRLLAALKQAYHPVLALIDPKLKAEVDELFVLALPPEERPPF
jgi:hypothetical protein